MEVSISKWTVEIALSRPTKDQEEKGAARKKRRERERVHASASYSSRTLALGEKWSAIVMDDAGYRENTIYTLPAVTRIHTYTRYFHACTL